LGNCEGNYQGGGDSPDLASVGSESVLGYDDNNNSGNKNNNSHGKTRGQAQGEYLSGSDADIESLS
jgi:hypothetical protein